MCSTSIQLKCQLWQTHLRNEGFVTSGSNGGFSMKHTIPYIKFKHSYYTLGLSIGDTKVWSKKEASKDSLEFVKVVSLIVKYSLFTLEENALHRPIWVCRSQYETQPSVVWTSQWQPSSASLDEGKSSPAHNRYTRAKLERLRSARLICRDHKDHDLDLQGFKWCSGLISILASTIEYY
jgi:hypothetical protein